MWPKQDISYCDSSSVAVGSDSFFSSSLVDGAKDSVAATVATLAEAGGSTEEGAESGTAPVVWEEATEVAEAVVTDGTWEVASGVVEAVVAGSP